MVNLVLDKRFRGFRSVTRPWTLGSRPRVTVGKAEGDDREGNCGRRCLLRPPRGEAHHLRLTLMPRAFIEQHPAGERLDHLQRGKRRLQLDRKSTRLNSSH